MPFWDLALPVRVSLVMFQTGRCISIRPCASLVNQLECTRKYWMLGTTGYSQLCHCETWPCQFVSHQLCFTLVDASVLYPVRHWWTSFNAQGSTKCYVADKVIVSMTFKLAMLAWMSDCHFWPPPSVIAENSHWHDFPAILTRCFTKAELSPSYLPDMATGPALSEFENPDCGQFGHGPTDL